MSARYSYYPPRYLYFFINIRQIYSIIIKREIQLPLQFRPHSKSGQKKKLSSLLTTEFCASRTILIQKFQVDENCSCWTKSTSGRRKLFFYVHITKPPMISPRRQVNSYVFNAYLKIFIISSISHLSNEDTATKILLYLSVGLSSFSSASQFSVSQFSVVIISMSP